MINGLRGKHIYEEFSFNYIHIPIGKMSLLSRRWQLAFRRRCSCRWVKPRCCKIKSMQVQKIFNGYGIIRIVHLLVTIIFIKYTKIRSRSSFMIYAFKQIYHGKSNLFIVNRSKTGANRNIHVHVYTKYKFIFSYKFWSLFTKTQVICNFA